MEIAVFLLSLPLLESKGIDKAFWMKIVIIPGSVTSIGDWNFMVANLSSVTLPDFITSYDRVH